MKITIEKADGTFYAMHENVLHMDRKPWFDPHAGRQMCYIIHHAVTDKMTIYPCSAYHIARVEN